MTSRHWIGLALIGLTGCAGMAFEPIDRLQVTPGRVGLPYEDVTLTTPTGTAVRGWLLPAQGIPRSTVLVMHNTIDNWDTQLLNVADLPSSGVNVLLIDYTTLGPGGVEPTHGLQGTIVPAVVQLPVHRISP